MCAQARAEKEGADPDAVDNAVAVVAVVAVVADVADVAEVAVAALPEILIP
jgi:hypothetical protein